MAEKFNESAAGGAAASASDATIAQAMQAVEQLSTVFGFEREVASEAVDAVGPDITAAYNWILDRGAGEDKGGPIVPRLDCPHVRSHMLVNPDTLQIGQPCSHFSVAASALAAAAAAPSGGLKGVTDEDGQTCPPGENWICLHCGATRCSRYVNGHAVAHWEQTKAESESESGMDQEGDDGAGHCIAVSLADLSVWCYECNSYLKHPRLEAVTRRLEALKFPAGSGGGTNGGGSGGRHHHPDEQTDREGGTDEEDKDSDEGNSGECSSSADDISPGAAYQHHGEGFAIPPPTITTKLPSDLEEMARHILSDECRSIAILAGAGMSKSSGIPDFRSAGGMYETLQPELLTASEIEREAMRVDPTTVFEKGMFLQNPLPCLELKRSFILGTREAEWRATIAHRFVELLHQKTGKLTRLYTQNIDGLEGQCKGLPREKVVPVHGSMDRAACEYCGTETDFAEFCNDVRRNIKDITGKDADAPSESSLIPCKLCTHAGVKPTIVLFRSSLPEEFFVKIVDDLPNIDLLIVVGTSLTVAPANTLVYRVPPTCLRMVVNNEPVGFRLGIEYGPESVRDFFAQGFCDEVFLDLICHLGWIEDLSKVADDLPEASARLLRDRLACMNLDEADTKIGC